MSNLDRLKNYAAARGPKGAGREQKNLDYWADRAEKNSEIAPRASKKMELFDTGKMNVRDSSMRQFEPRKVNRQMEGRDDPNHLGSGYMKNVRRSI